MKEIILVGAARSGTKILRDTLAVAFGWGCVPYDIGYVWHAHTSSAHDGFDPADLDDRAVRYVRGFVQKYGLGSRGVVEKTVGNSLRVPAVHRVFPDALYIHLVRDGVDVVNSAVRQWVAPSDYRYLIRKARHFPISQVPSYGFDYLRAARERGRPNGGLTVWGPKYPGIQSDVETEPVEVVCARQWSACVASAAAGFDSVDAQVINVRYEEFVRYPARTVDRVADAVGMKPDSRGLERAIERVRPPVGGMERSVPNSEFGPQLAKIMDGELKRLGYETVGRND